VLLLFSPGSRELGVGAQEGLHNVGDGVSARHQPDGSWGLSNAEQIAHDDASPAAATIDTLVNTHGTHLPAGGARIVSTVALGMMATSAGRR
jgi:hypothetical protein